MQNIQEIDARISYFEEKLQGAIGRNAPLLIISQLRDNLKFLKEKRIELLKDADQKVGFKRT